ncbi:hypothetical protein AHAS_Ahas15G0384600 [Arachis hypogaea]
MKDKDKISAPISLDTSSQNDPINHLTLPSKKSLCSLIYLRNTCCYRILSKGILGVIWVLEQYKVSKFWLEKSAKDHKRKREVLEVSPVKKHGKIKGESLILTEHDGSETTIWLKGCVVEAVSSSSLPSKKRAKRYPIKVENNKSVVYHGSKLLYIYLETSWEKEAWCKALRMASRDQSEKLKWSSQLYEECHRYLASLNIEYHPFIMRPSAGSSFDGLEKSKKSSLKPSLVCGFYKINVGPSYKINLISGGAVVEIETRLEVGEPPNDKGTECSSNAGGAPSDLLEDLSNGDGVNDSQEPKVDVNGNTDKHKNTVKSNTYVVESIKVKDVNLSYADVSKVSRSTSSSFYGSKWKSMLNSLAKHVSQVPLTLAIRIVYLKGIMRLQLNPPPSDNLWYGFTLMPDIDFNLESCVRDHKITNARIALFLLNRLKENWIPRTVAPYMWVKQECGHDTSASNDSARISVEAYIMQQTEDLKELPASSIENENRDETREEKTEDITVYQPQTLLMDKQVSPSEQKKNREEGKDV